MSTLIVHCPPETRHHLTVEKKGTNGVTAALADLEGEAIVSDGITYAGDHPAAVEVFLDTITGKKFARVSIAKAAELRKKNTEVFQGVGGAPGWFVPAPDLSVKESKPPAPPTKQ